MIHTLLSCDSKGWVRFEHASEEISYSGIAKVGWYRRKLAALYLPEKVCFKFSEERKLANEDNIENDAASPNICSETVIRLFTDYIRVHVVRSTAIDRQLLIFLHSLTETEINYFDLLCREVH